MPCTINPIRKALLKKNLLDPKNSIKSAMIKAGYSPNTAIKSGANKVVKVSQAEIAQELRFSDLTPEHFTRKSELVFSKALSLKKPDLTNAMRATEFQGRIAGVDKQSPTTVNIFETDSLSLSADALTALARRR